MRRGILASFLFLSCSAAWAAPSISSISGTVSNGQNVTITGSGFGANGQTTVIWDRFEGGTLSQTIRTGGSSVADIGTWQNSGSYPPTYGSTTSVSGSQAMLVNFTKPSSSFDVRAQMSSVTDFFISYWWFVPAADAWPGELEVDHTNWKQIWVYNNSDISGGDQTLVSLLGNGNPWYMACDACPTQTYDADPESPLKGTWHRKWFYLKGSETATGEQEAWELTLTSGVINGISKTGVATLNSGAVYNYVSVPGYGRRDTVGSQEVIALYDDILIATGTSGSAQARIEICDQANYASTSLKKITVATVNSWSSTSISAKVWQGNFTNGQTAYVFVFDNTGAHNATGYAVTLGQTSTQLAPTVVAGVTVSSFSVNWSSAGAQYVVALSTSSDFIPTISSGPLTARTTSFVNLAARTTYYVEVKNSTNSTFTDSVSTLTAWTELNPSFSGVSSSGLTINWTTVMGANAIARLASDAGMTTIVSSVTVSGNSNAFSGLSSSTQYWGDVWISTESINARTTPPITTTTSAPPVAGNSSSAVKNSIFKNSVFK